MKRETARGGVPARNIKRRTFIKAGAAVRSLRPHEKAKANAATAAGVRGRKIVK